MPHSLFNTVGIRRILRPVNLNLKTKGVSPALKEVVIKCSSAFNIEMPEATKNIMEKNGVLVVCNHPAQADVLVLLAAIPHRKDTFLVAMHSLMSILPAINKHIIPVYIGHLLDVKVHNKFIYGLFKKMHFNKEYSQEVAHKKNIKSMVFAAKKIDEGALVGIFPTGGLKNSREFLPGVGHIIKNLKSPKKASIVMAYVSGTSSWDFFRVIPVLNKIFPKLRIKFSEPMQAEKFIAENGRQISHNLQKVYDRWSIPFEHLPKLKIAAIYLRSLLPFIFFRGH